MHMKKLIPGFVGGVLLGAVLLAPAVWAGIGSGALMVDDNTTLCPDASGSYGFEPPNEWDVAVGEGVHLNITAALSLCTSGHFTGKPCINDEQCSTRREPGVCSASPQLECSGTTTSVFIEGRLYEGPCTSSGVCTGNAEACVNDRDCVVPFEDTLTANFTGSTTIDVCYTTQALMCGDADVAYCNQHTLVNNSVNGKGKGKGKGWGRRSGVSVLQAAESLGTPIDCPCAFSSPPK